jgi:carboxyl-terminal processing protease
VGNFRAIRQKQNCLKGCLAQFKGKMDKTNLYLMLFKIPSGLDIDLSKNKAIVKRYLAAEFADNCMEKAIITKLF